MTVKYECDRCHKQFEDKKDVVEVNYEADNGGYTVRGQLHYCVKCSIYYNNAVHNVNNRTFDGFVCDAVPVGFRESD